MLGSKPSYYIWGYIWTGRRQPPEPVGCCCSWACQTLSLAGARLYFCHWIQPDYSWLQWQLFLFLLFWVIIIRTIIFLWGLAVSKTKGDLSLSSLAFGLNIHNGLLFFLTAFLSALSVFYVLVVFVACSDLGFILCYQCFLLTFLYKRHKNMTPVSPIQIYYHMQKTYKENKLIKKHGCVFILGHILFV